MANASSYLWLGVHQCLTVADDGLQFSQQLNTSRLLDDEQELSQQLQQ